MNDPLEMVIRISTGRPEWTNHAACKGLGPDLFFPDRGETWTSLAAAAICDTCPVQAPCAEQGSTERFGIWGGNTRNNRLGRNQRRVA